MVAGYEHLTVADVVNHIEAAQDVWMEAGMWTKLLLQIESAAGYKQLVFDFLENLDDNNEHYWRKPQPGTLKCNIDAACYVNSNQFCIGACLRDAAGGFLKAFTQTFEGQPEVRESEAITMLVCWRQSSGCNTIIHKSSKLKRIVYNSSKVLKERAGITWNLDLY
ncbi:cytochrome p450 [Trifolium pratense]|uniref:Cytochrome p450 n=1 Tax=Trifolium pratense TaxID=57577 RepID=A0A2K3NKQ7_TRIPR|nr:cytochrome p450 [Trifolium pratense]